MIVIKPSLSLIKMMKMNRLHEELERNNLSIPYESIQNIKYTLFQSTKSDLLLRTSSLQKILSKPWKNLKLPSLAWTNTWASYGKLWKNIWIDLLHSVNLPYNSRS